MSPKVVVVCRKSRAFFMQKSIETVKVLIVSCVRVASGTKRLGRSTQAFPLGFNSVKVNQYEP